MDADTIALLAAIPVDQHDLPPDLLQVASSLAHVIRIDCPASTVAPVAHALEAPPTPRLSPLDSSEGKVVSGVQGVSTGRMPTRQDSPVTPPPAPPTADAAGARLAAVPHESPSRARFAADFGDLPAAAAKQSPAASSAPLPGPTRAATTAASLHLTPASSLWLIGLSGVAAVFLAGGAGAFVLLRRRPRTLS
jgi:hypothetical protein